MNYDTVRRDKNGRQTSHLTGPQFIWDLEDKYGISVSGILCPVAYFQHGRMDGNYNGDAVIVTLDKKEGPLTFEEYYFPSPHTQIRLTAESTDEEIRAVLEALGRRT